MNCLYFAYIPDRPKGMKYPLEETEVLSSLFFLARYVGRSLSAVSDLYRILVNRNHSIERLSKSLFENIRYNNK